MTVIEREKKLEKSKRDGEDERERKRERTCDGELQ
jgi:hypothetical protein